MPATQGKQPRRFSARVVSPGSISRRTPTKAGGRSPYSPPSLVHSDQHPSNTPTKREIHSMTTTATAIETAYRGHLFRSRLEARWAAMFDLLGWSWTYEPFDANGYIPDFVLHGDRPVLVEVKPELTYDELAAHSERIETAIHGTWKGDYLI